MDTINLEPNDKKDLLELLDYALEKKLETEPELKGTQRWDDRPYWKLRIYQLKKLVNGYQTGSSYIQSSLSSEEPTERQKAKMRYKESLVSDIDDLLNYKEEHKEF